MELDDDVIKDIREFNPFVHALRLSDKTDLRKVKNTDYKLIDSSNKIVDTNIVYAEEKISDKSEFVKVYEDGHKAQRDLSRAGYKLLNYILYRKLKFNNDVFDFVPDDFISEEEESRSVTYSAINELQTKGIIAKRMKYPNTYFINPTMFYRGERRFLKLKYNNY